MPTLFRFLMVVGVIAGVVTGSLYVLGEYFQPEPKEISKALRNVKGRIEETTASTPSADTGAIAPAAIPDPGPDPDELAAKQGRRASSAVSFRRFRAPLPADLAEQTAC